MGVIACSVAQSKSLHLASEPAHTYYQTTFSLLPLLLFAQLFYYSQVVSRDAALSTGNPEGPRLARVDNWAVYMGPAERSEGETTSERETRGMYERKKKRKRYRDASGLPAHHLVSDKLRSQPSQPQLALMRKTKRKRGNS